MGNHIKSLSSCSELVIRAEWFCIRYGMESRLGSPCGVLMLRLKLEIGSGVRGCGWVMGGCCTPMLSGDGDNFREAGKDVRF